MAIRIDLHDKAADHLRRAWNELELYDLAVLDLQGGIPPRELAIRRVLTDILLAVQLTHEAVGG